MAEVNELASSLKQEQNQHLTIQQENQSSSNYMKAMDGNVEKQNNQFIGSQNKFNKESSTQTKKNQKEDSTLFSFDALGTKSFQQTAKKVKQQNKKLYQKNKSILKDIEEEKKQVEQQLNKLDQQINQLKQKHKEHSRQKQKEKQQSQHQALKNAKLLVHYYKAQKKLDKQKRIQQTKKSIQKFKKQQQTFKSIFLQKQKQLKSQKRRAITLRIQDVKKKQEQRILLDHQRNKVVHSIIKEQQILKQREKLPQKIAELQQRRIQLYQKKDHLDIRQIEEHQRNYIQKKQLQKSQVISRKSVSLSHPIPKFKKNIWAQRIEAQQQQKKSQQKQRQLSRKFNLQNKIKYSELVKNIFLPKRKQRVMTQVQVHRNAGTPDIFHNNSVHLPAISESQKGINDTKMMKKFRQNYKLKMNISKPSSQNQKSTRKIYTQKSSDEIDQERKRVERLIELKKETQERLKKIEEKRYQKLLQSEKKAKPIYKNYLGSLKMKRKSNPKDWKKIIENSQLSNEQKYTQMIKKITQLENKAKQNEYKQKQGKQISVEFYINSIQAKLALLQKC